MDSILSSFFQFIKNPSYISFNHKINVYELLLLGGVYFVCAFFLGFIAKVYCIITHIQYTIGHLDIANNILFSSILIVILAPIKEEIQLRLLLRPQKPNLFLFNAAMLLTFGVFIYYEKWQQAFIYFIVMILVSLVFVVFKEQIKILYSKYFPFVFYFSASLFALLHINNYDGSRLYLMLGIVILVAPQLVSGIITGYLRIKYGLKYAILFHIINNFISLIFVLKLIAHH